MTTKYDAIRSLCPNAEFALVGGKDITWQKMNGESVPSESEITAEITRLDKVYEDNKYQRDRAAEFPDWQTQLDYIFHHGLAKWKTDIVQPVKEKFPKPS
tara:strand:- start:3110 stop:3409 length:300 start_codon:yes stop_codon:yes gene_type:complete